MARTNALRNVVSVPNMELKPYDRYGPVLEKMFWHPLNYDFETGSGNYILRLDPGARSTPHTHTDIEQIMILQGSLIEDDGEVFGPGDHITYLPGSQHFSTTEEGCLLVAHVAKHYEVISPDNSDE